MPAQIEIIFYDYNNGEPKDEEVTTVKFQVDGDVTTDLLVDYFVRFAVAAGFSAQAVYQSIVDYSNRLEKP